MTDKIKISTILHRAADRYLAANPYEFDRDETKHNFSCVAVEYACEDLTGIDYWKDDQYDRILDGLQEMGLDPASSGAFKPWYKVNSAEMQGARFIWLKWAALMAEEQGQ